MIQFVNSIRAGHSITSAPECVTNKRREQRHASIEACGTSRFFEIALVFVRLDHVSRFIANANHSAMGATAKLCVADCIARRIRFALPRAGFRPVLCPSIDRNDITSPERRPRHDYAYPQQSLV